MVIWNPTPPSHYSRGYLNPVWPRHFHRLHTLIKLALNCLLFGSLLTFVSCMCWNCQGLCVYIVCCSCLCDAAVEDWPLLCQWSAACSLVVFISNVATSWQMECVCVCMCVCVCLCVCAREFYYLTQIVICSYKLPPCCNFVKICTM